MREPTRRPRSRSDRIEPVGDPEQRNSCWNEMTDTALDADANAVGSRQVEEPLDIDVANVSGPLTGQGDLGGCIINLGRLRK